MSRIHLLNRMTEELKLIQTLQPSARQPCYLGEHIQWWLNLHDIERWVDGGLCRLRLLRLGIDSRQDGRVLLSRHLARDARLLVDTHLGGLSDLWNGIVEKRGCLVKMRCRCCRETASQYKVDTKTGRKKRSLCNEGTGLVRCETGKGKPRAARQGGRSEDKLQQSGTEPCKVNALTTWLGEADGEDLEIGGWGCGRGRGKRRVGGTGADEGEG